MTKIRVGIFFGGPSREREVSFAGGRTVYDNLDKSIFEPIPLFVDSFGNIAELDWENIYKGSIKDFYPPVEFLPQLPHGFQIYAENLAELSSDIPKTTRKKLEITLLEKIGKPIKWDDLQEIIDFAFLALHGTSGEDGSIQGILEWLNIPYSGSGIFASSLGINKNKQKKFQSEANLYINSFTNISNSQWDKFDNIQKHQFFQEVIKKVGEKLVIKPAHQGSSLGVTVLTDSDFDAFCNAIDLGFFKMHLDCDDFNIKSSSEQIQWIKEFTDIRSGFGLPVTIGNTLIQQPQELLSFINKRSGKIEIIASDSESEVIIESYIEGKEFSCIVVENTDGSPLALPPTEIRKTGELFDYRSKYLPGLSRKVTPIEIEDEQIQKIREACSELYNYFGFQVYARIDGFITNNSEIFLNDPNTTSGMMPSSFFFHQAAEAGLNPSQFLSFIIYTSLKSRIQDHPNGKQFLNLWNQLINKIQNDQDKQDKETIGIIMGGYSFERHISMESGRNIYEKISSSANYNAFPIFLTGDSSAYQLHTLPIHVMLKDNADDIKQKVLNPSDHPLINQIREEARAITNKFGSSVFNYKSSPITLSGLKELTDGVFIALHGRPGEDGRLQKDLQEIGIYFNGSESHSSEITINKFNTNEYLANSGFYVAKHVLVQKEEFLIDEWKKAKQISKSFEFPLIAKPSDDGCSAAVRKVKDEQELIDFLKLIFRESIELDDDLTTRLNIGKNDEFPMKTEVLIEEFIEKGDCDHFLEVTGGLLTHFDEQGNIQYEIFEPSESLAESEILSLEEKFLAGEGQNLTPSRFSKNQIEQERISTEVRKTFESVAKTLKVTGYCRIDAFVKIFKNGDVKTYIIEINSLPGMTPATCIYHQAAINGYKPFDFIREILNFGKKRNQLING